MLDRRFGTASWALTLSAAILLTGPTVLAFFSGGYGVKSQQLGAAVAFFVLGVLVATAPWPPIRGRAALVAVTALAALALWTGVSIAWAPVRDLAADETAQLTLYSAVFAAALVVMRDPTVRRWTAPALLAGVLVVAIYALAGRLLPDLVAVAFTARAGSRIQQPITYWNALGLLMALGILLGAAVAAGDDRDRRLRAAACAAAVPCALVLYLTFSRGSLVALAAGYLALLLARPRPGALLAGALALASGAVLALVLQLFPAVLELNRGSSEQTAQGAVMAVVLVAATLAVGVLFARLSRSRALPQRLELPGRVRSAIAVLSVAAVVGLGWLIASGSETTEPLPSSQGRLATIATSRGDYWGVALDALAAEPITGAGSGSFSVEWRRERNSREFALDAHSLYVEILGELGLVGGLLLAAFLVPVLLAVVRLAAHVRDPVGPAAAAGLAAFLVHVGLDWTWEFPAVTLVPLLLAAAALAPAVLVTGGPTNGRALRAGPVRAEPGTSGAVSAPDAVER
jgi:hypothetical protein